MLAVNQPKGMVYDTVILYFENSADGPGESDARRIRHDGLTRLV